MPERPVTCGECDAGLVAVNGCTCGGGPEYAPHEPLCGMEPCPNGCWWKLHPAAPGAPGLTVASVDPGAMEALGRVIDQLAEEGRDA